jgi:Rrf2 family protein
MLSLSKKTDYALLALSYLAHVEIERPVNTKEIAEQYDIPVELLAKILQQLAKAKLVASTPGPTGGYRLARTAEEISIGSIVEIIEGVPALVQCLRPDHTGCEQQEKCTIRTPLTRINARIMQVLYLTSLAEICREESEESIALRLYVPRAELAGSR